MDDVLSLRCELLEALQNGECSAESMEHDIIQRNPLVLEKVDYVGRLPLHHACFAVAAAAAAAAGEEEHSSRQLDIVRTLVKLCPESVGEFTHYGETALQVACEGNASLEVIQFLLECNPDAALWRDQYGKTPLHYACNKDTLRSKEIQLLMSFRPESLNIQSGEGGDTPLNRLCMNPNASTPLIESVYNACPEAATWGDNDGDTPLHNACIQRCLVAVHFLSKRRPSLCLLRNKRGLTPYERYRNDPRVVDNDSQILRCLEEVTCALIFKPFYSSTEATAAAAVMPFEIASDIAQRVADIYCTVPCPTMTELLDLSSSETTAESSDSCGCCSSRQLWMQNQQDIHHNFHELLRNHAFQQLLQGFINMNRPGRKTYIQNEPENKAKGIVVCSSAVESVSSMFHLLRGNALQCIRRR